MLAMRQEMMSRIMTGEMRSMTAVLGCTDKAPSQCSFGFVDNDDFVFTTWGTAYNCIRRPIWNFRDAVECINGAVLYALSRTATLNSRLQAA